MRYSGRFSSPHRRRAQAPRIIAALGAYRAAALRVYGTIGPIAGVATFDRGSARPGCSPMARTGRTARSPCPRLHEARRWIDSCGPAAPRGTAPKRGRNKA